MKRRSIESIVKLASDFERLALVVKGAGLSSDAKNLYVELQRFLRPISISMEDFTNWLQNNASVLGRKAEEYWYINYEGLLEIHLPSSNQDSSKLALISKTKELPSSWEEDEYRHLDITELGILKGDNNIPNLYLITVESFAKSSIGVMPKEMLHEEYLFTAFNELFDITKTTPQAMLDFFQRNKKSIDRIRTLFKGKPVLLGSGSDGVAFGLGDQFVLKIFKDTHAYEQAVKAKERLHDHPELAGTEAMIYDVGILGEFGNEMVYYYIIEKMKPVRSLDYKSQDALEQISKSIARSIEKNKGSALTLLKAKIDDPTKYKEIKGAVDQISAQMASEIRYSHLSPYVNLVETQLKLKDNWLYLFVQELIMKYLTSRTDVHLGNLGVTQQGHLRYFDPAYSDWTSELNL